ncbi:MAG: hypothetical protein Q9207_006539 [Kuettlingeria erythrocarpa]
MVYKRYVPYSPELEKEFEAVLAASLRSLKRSASSPPPRIRKKLAVTQTRDPAIKTLVKANGRNSPLLKLPEELRIKIFRDVLGDQLIHVKYDKSITYVKEPPRISHSVCSADTTEHAAYRKSMYGSSKVPHGDDSNHYSESCEKRHSSCYSTSRDEDQTGKKLSLSLLGVSRQTYEEAHDIFWATNTFSFHTPSDFKEFVSARNFVQRKKLAKLHLQITWRSSGITDWNRPWLKRLMGNLPGLRTLDLCLEVAFPPNPDSQLPSPTVGGPDLDCWLAMFLNFQQLPLRQARVIVAESRSLHRYLSKRKLLQDDRRSTWIGKRELACYLEARLLSEPGVTDLSAQVARKLEAERLEREARMM